MNVTLRKKKITGARQSLYLDFYPAIPNPVTGKPTRREFLGLYIFNRPTNVFDKKHNEETKILADSIRSQRQLAIQSGNYGFLIEDKKQNDFLLFFKELADKHKAENRGDKNNWLSVYNYLVKFTHGHCKAGDITEKFCNEFKEYIQTVKTDLRSKKKLTTNSAAGYFIIFKTALKKAYNEKLLTEPFFNLVPSIRKTETQREFLTNEELQKLAKVDCDIPELKRASLFSALTGLRYSDIEKLIWREVISNKGEHSIRFTQKKTRGVETHPINEDAFMQLGERGNPDERVFKELIYSSHQNIKIQKWVTDAGIKKTITFHCFRHTYATLQLTLGTDIYTVSKMLGHRDLHTTQVYAKIIDKTKREASNKIKLDL